MLGSQRRQPARQWHAHEHVQTHAGRRHHAVSIAPGAEHGRAIFADSTMRCWGGNNFSQLGNTSGAVHACALLDGGAVRCWGMGADGRLGDDATLDRFTPVSVMGSRA